jgi:hypothetical protein
MCVSAIASIFIPLASFSLVGWKIWIYVWAGSLTVGGLMGVLSALLRNMGIELIAITLLLTGYIAYIAVVVARLIFLVNGGHWAESTGTIYVLFSTLALCLLLVRRYAELWQLTRASRTLDGTT